MVRYSGTFFGVLFVTFFNFLVPGRVDRVGGEELEISVHLNRVLCPTIIKWPSWRIAIASTFLSSLPLQLIPSTPRVLGLPSHQSTPWQRTEDRPEIKMYLLVFDPEINVCLLVFNPEIKISKASLIDKPHLLPFLGLWKTAAQKRTRLPSQV